MSRTSLSPARNHTDIAYTTLPPRPPPPFHLPHHIAANPTGTRDSATGSSSAKSSVSSDEAARPRVVFGRGIVTQLPAELDRLALSAPIIVSSPSRIALARRIQAMISKLDSRILDSALTNVPAHVVEDVVSRISGRDCVISIGGGSAVSLARAISVRKRIPHVCIPTTYSGSEMLPLLSQTILTDSRRFAGHNPKTLPSVIMYDENLTMSASRRISVPDYTPTELTESRNRLSNRDDSAQWSYLHLPGV